MVDLISENPASAAYRAMMGEMDRQKRSELDYERGMREEAEARRTQASRLAGITADNQRRAAEAQFTAQTLAPRVQVQQEQAKQAVTSTRLRELDAQDAENRAFYQVIKLALTGDIASAREIARRSGQDIPEEILRNNQIMGMLDRAAQQAQQLYPSSPAKQQQHMESFMQGLREAQAPGRATLDERMGNQNPRATRDPGTFMDRPGAEYQRLPGMPEPDQTNTKGRRPLQFEVKRDAALALGASPEEAFAIASGQKPMSEAQIYDMASKIVGREMPSSNWSVTPEQRRVRVQEVMQELRGMGAASTFTPTFAPASAAPGPDTPATRSMQPASASQTVGGLGTREDPYQAKTQAHIDWFRQNAPAGSVISVNGTLYTK